MVVSFLSIGGARRTGIARRDARRWRPQRSVYAKRAACRLPV